MTTERKDGPTAAGGTYALVTYLDERNIPVEQDEATRIVIKEYDASDRLLFETRGRISRLAQNPDG